MAGHEAEVAEWLERWRLEPDGDGITTATSRLLPVRWGQEPAMLKVAWAEEEVRGGHLMAWWNGRSAARVFRHEGPAILLERARMERSLRRMASTGGDDEAVELLCQVACSLHQAEQREVPSSLVKLEDWFAALAPAAARYGGMLALSQEVAQELLSTQEEVRVLHGDLHHDNVLDFGERGWLAIDPKGLLGERTFEFANLLRNPGPELALRPGRLLRQATAIASSAGVSRRRLLQWTLALGGVSAAWILSDGDHPTLDLAIATLAAQELGIELPTGP